MVGLADGDLMYSITIDGLPAVLAHLSELGAGAARFASMTAIVTPGALNYAGYVSSGTRPHDIYPRNARVLAWPAAGTPTRATGRAAAGNNDMVFAMHVHHPGTKPNTYVEEAVKAASAGVVVRVSAAVTAVVEGGPAGLLAAALNASALEVQAAVMRGAPVKTGTLRRAWHTELTGI